VARVEKSVERCLGAVTIELCRDIRAGVRGFRRPIAERTKLIHGAAIEKLLHAAFAFPQKLARRQSASRLERFARKGPGRVGRLEAALLVRRGEASSDDRLNLLRYVDARDDPRLPESLNCRAESSL